jgi:hypothetical protein
VELGELEGVNVLWAEMEVFVRRLNERNGFLLRGDGMIGKVPCVGDGGSN